MSLKIEVSRHNTIIIPLSIGIILLIMSCTPGSCFENTNANVKAWFYTTAKDITVAQAPDSITLYGLNKSSEKIYNKAVKQQPAGIPLDPSVSTCSFILKINGIADTLTFTYSSYPHFISKECGYTFYHVIDTPLYTTNKIKSIILRKNTITTLNEDNIRILY